MKTLEFMEKLAETDEKLELKGRFRVKDLPDVRKYLGYGSNCQVEGAPKFVEIDIGYFTDEGVEIYLPQTFKTVKEDPADELQVVERDGKKKLTALPQLPILQSVQQQQRINMFACPPLNCSFLLYKPTDLAAKFTSADWNVDKPAPGWKIAKLPWLYNVDMSQGILNPEASLALAERAKKIGGNPIIGGR